MHIARVRKSRLVRHQPDAHHSGLLEPRGKNLIAAGTDLFGRGGRCRFGEIRRTLLEERRKRFLRF